jgi:hypothetical protein
MVLKAKVYLKTKKFQCDFFWLGAGRGEEREMFGPDSQFYMELYWITVYKVLFQVLGCLLSYWK